ncbi:hypothetical protein Pan97_24800 [Bremerella volcania]|uniref:Uncharacterized protein n=1 Tax=Bremerella volcania TaxID=2527984 RepID=A0A518C888_9BACT|nr:hypothetical protein [Bremerella volcania]QDU75448.1 hypothetical protein Pan97_24800 [Bremerella volcania]
MASDNTMHKTRHWHTFSTGAKSHIARRYWQYRADFRDQVVKAALKHWPETFASTRQTEIVEHIFRDANFRSELRLGPITWWLLGLAIKAILSALVDYWFQTAKSTLPNPFKRPTEPSS